jgi:lactaldehyde dehydrogenase
MNMLLGGKWIGSERKLAVLNPYDQSVIDTVPKASVGHVGQALAFAASYDYRLSPWQRYEILHGFCQDLMARKDEVSRLITKEAGKPIRESQQEVERAYQTFLLAAEEAKRIPGEILPVDAIRNMPPKMALVLREPIGVVVAITPFNFPLNLAAHKVGPAIAANNPVVLKPSSLTPLTALLMAELLLKAGLPPEMLQVITGDSREIGDALVLDPLVQKIHFTGSVPVGKGICQKTGMKRITMELGGNAPLVVLDDADVDKVVPRAVLGAFANAGQRCTSLKRCIVHDRLADRFISLFVQQTETLRVGDPTESHTDVGPLITEQAAIRIEETVHRAVAGGAMLLCGGKRHGAFHWPTVLDHVAPASPIAMEETFGPVTSFIRVSSFEEAIAVANCTSFGLQAGVFTNDLNRALEAARRIEAGAVMINEIPGFRAEHLPFGGVKDSGVGREGVKYAIAEMTRLKTVVL